MIATYVELCTRLGGVVQCGEIGTHDIIASFDARGDCEVENALVLNQVVDSPRVGSGVKALFSDLEPFETRDIFLCGRVHPRTAESMRVSNLRNCVIWKLKRLTWPCTLGWVRDGLH